MDKRLRNWGLAGVVVIFALAGLWHFAYDLWSNPITAVISPVNESPWEHAKLFFVPAILFFAAQYRAVGKEYPNYLFAHSIALLIMPVVMLLLYGLYGSRVEHSLPLDLINTAVTIATGLLVAYKLTTSEFDFSSRGYRIAALLIPVAMLFVYALFTFFPPQCGLFFDRTTGAYGL